MVRTTIPRHIHELTDAILADSGWEWVDMKHDDGSDSGELHLFAPFNVNVSQEVCDDKHNNIGRMCSIPGDTVARRQYIIHALTDNRYMVFNLDTRIVSIVPQNNMRNLY